MRNSLRIFAGGWFRKKTRSKQRAVIRGSRKLKQNGRQKKIADLKRVLSDTVLDIDSSQFSSFIMGDGISNRTKELCLRQYLLLRLGSLTLNEALLSQQSDKNRSVIFPLPKQWRGILEKDDFDVNNWCSEFCLYGYVIMMLGYGIYRVAAIVCGSLVNFKLNAETPAPFVFFCNLSEGNLPKPKGGVQSYDILSWYIKYLRKSDTIATIKHDVRGVSRISTQGISIESQAAGPIPNLPGLKDICIFACWAFLSVLISLFDLLRGRWWHALIFHESVLAKQARMTKSTDLANEYFFHQIGQTYRPLWSYYAESKGCNISLYFYSINIEGINLDPTYFWRCMTWPKYIVWDSWQKNFISRCIGNQPDVEIEIVKSIWFQDSGSGKLPRQTEGIAIFDVMPHRHFQYCKYADEDEYVLPQICLTFIQDIREVARQNKITCCYKAKREIGKLCHPSYRPLIKKMSTSTDVTVISSDTSAYELISLSSLVICFPFTAPAVIARELGKPACYYDPEGIIDDNHPAAHGIKIIGSKSALLSWVNEQLTC